MMNTNIFFVIFLASCYMVEAYKILVVFPFPARSHNNLGNGFVRHLLKAGHEVTYITPFPLEKPHKNLRQIDVSENREVFPENVINIHALMNKEVDMTNEKPLFFEIFNVAENTLKNKNVLKLLNNHEEQFDVAVIEWMFNEVYTGFAAVFNCPYIWSFPYEPHANILSLIDETTNPAYVPHLVSSNIPPLSFVQRVEELLYQMYSMGMKTFYFPQFEKDVYNGFLEPILARRGRSLPPYDEMRYNASIMLGGSHVSFGQAISLPQSYKSIGGYHIEEEVEPLPDDLQKVLDDAREGVIYFSMGSNLKSKDLSLDIKRGLIRMFGRLKQTVVWKFEEDFSDMPKNVHVLKWAPQQSILAHPNCILFISHGGLLSLIETVHFGVPLIGIPVFADQFNNVVRSVKKGFGIRVDISQSLADDLESAINKFLSDPRYRQRAEEISLVYHDRPMSPGAELVHWVEHVVHTRGAPHLRSPALMVPWYQKMYLDLAALIVFVLLFLKTVMRRLFCLPKKRVTKKKSN